MKKILLLILAFTGFSTSYCQDYNDIQEKVVFMSGDITLAGTLTIPQNEVDYPAIVMITGGGNRNRDAQYRKFKPFKLIAEYLAPRGVAVLRYDDRGIGKSTGEKSLSSTLEDFKADALAAVQYLKTRNDLDIGKIGIFGHCAGGTAAIRAAVESDDIDFVITMAGCGMTGAETLLFETREILEAEGRSEQDILELQALRKDLFHVMRTDQGWGKIEKDIEIFIRKRYDSLSPGIKDKYPAFEDLYRATYDKSYLSYGKNRYMMDFIDADPIPSYRKYKGPILALYGEKDRNVSPKHHITPVKQALQKAGNKSFRFEIIPEANHYFIQSWRDTLFAPGFLPAIHEWLSREIINAEPYLRSLALRTMEEGNLPGMGLAIVKKDSVILMDGFGVRKLGGPELVDEHTLFQVASLTKPFTASMVGIMKDKGIVKLDDPIVKHMSDFKLSNPEITKMITIRDVLSARTGLNIADDSGADTRSKYVALLDNQSISASFRSQFSSINESFTFAGYLMEYIKGKSWENLVKDYLLNPLKMSETYTDIQSALANSTNVSTPYITKSGNLFPTAWDDVGVLSPAASLISSVNDLSKFLQLYLNEGNVGNIEVLGKDTYHQITSPQVIVEGMFKNLFNSQTDFMTFGLGWFISEYNGYKVIEMEGSLPGTSSLMALVPELDIGIVILTNKHFAFDSLVKMKFQIIDYFLSRMD